MIAAFGKQTRYEPVEMAAYGYALTTLAHSSLFVWLWRDAKFRAAPAVRPMAAAVALTAAWGAAAMLFLARQDFAIGWLASNLDLARYAYWLAFLWGLLGSPSRAAGRSRPGPLRFAAFALPLLVLLLSSWQTLRLPGAELSGRLALIAALSLPVAGMVLVEQLYRNVSEDFRWTIKPLCLGLGMVFIFDIYTYSHAALFSGFDSDAVNARGLVHGLAVPLLLLAAMRQAGHVDQLRLSRSAVFHTATLLLAGLYLLFISAVGFYVRRYGGDWGSALQLAFLFVATALLLAVLLSGAVRSKLRVFLAKNFFAYRYDYRAEWLRFTAMLSATAAPDTLAVSVIHALADLVESPGASLWLRNEARADFAQAARWNMAPIPHREPEDSSLARFLIESGWIIDIDECRERPARYPKLTLPPWLSMPTVWLLVPLSTAESRLIGFAVLTRPRARVTIDWEVRDLLKTAARQASVFLAQMQASEALLEARKFEAFNRMSAFVVHDLKNIVTQLSLMLKNAKRLASNPEFQQDMLSTVENSLEKMRQLMLQLRQGEVTQESYAGVDLAPIARRLRDLAAKGGRRVELSANDGIFARGDPARIERVLGHVVQNAVEATSVSDRVWIDVRRNAGRAAVVVGDTGQGMSREFMETRLFKPFHSTKAEGMGIGVYESLQYLKELGGDMAVESEPGQGTIVTISLPILDVAPLAFAPEEGP